MFGSPRKENLILGAYIILANWGGGGYSIVGGEDVKGNQVRSRAFV